MAEPEIETKEAEAAPVTDCDVGLHYPLALNLDNQIICHRCGHIYMPTEKPKPTVKRIKNKTKKIKKSSPKRRG